MWHTHPYGPARPSPTDEEGMGWIVSPSGTGRRALMLILGGDESTWDRWREDGQTPDVYARQVERHMCEKKNRKLTYSSRGASNP